MTKRNLNLLLILFIISDVVYSFIQYDHTSLDGDMAPIILPDVRYSTVMKDPFALNVLLENKIYGAPNRFFAHWNMSSYFKSVPFLLQKFFSPIDSVYASAAIAKTVIHLLILFFLAQYISGSGKIAEREFLIAAALLTPLFQTNGYNGVMGIILHSITYTFFYSLPVGLLLLFFWPFFKKLYYREPFKPNFIGHLSLILLIVILSFNGAIAPAVILIVCPTTLLFFLVGNFISLGQQSFVRRILNAVRNIPRSILVYFSLFTIISAYSIWIGRNNSENFAGTISLFDRYSRIPGALYEMLTNKLGLPLLIMVIILNAVIIHKQFRNEGQKILQLMKWTMLFSSLYILLLPLGGYREYRPGIVRFDTIIPVIVGLMLSYGISTFFLLRNLVHNYLKSYVGLIIVVSFIFILADAPEAKNNACERYALEQISQSPASTIVLEGDCTILSWEKITEPQQSQLNSQLLQLWGITKTLTLYSQQ